MISVLKIKNFFLLFSGRLLTNLGDSIYSVAAMWLVFKLTGSSFYTGLAGMLIMLPGIFEFLVGPLIDRWRLKSILIYTQWIQAFVVMAVPLSYFLGFLNVWLVIFVMLIATSIEQIVYPAQQAALPKLLKKEDLVAGNSLMTFAYQGTDIVLVGLSGILIVYIGVINIYLIDVLTFVLAALIFGLMKFPLADTNPSSLESKKSYFSELKEGKDFVKNSIILKMLIPLTIINFIFGMITAIMPEFSSHIGGEAFYGYFLCTMSISLLLGSLLSQILTKLPLGYTTISCFFLSAFFWFCSYLSSHPLMILFNFGLAFIPIGIHNVILVSTIQSLVPEELTGRVFALVGSLSALFLPIGSLLGGFLSTQIEIKLIYGLGSFAILFIAMYWLLTSKLRALPAPGNVSEDHPQLSVNDENSFN
ncbi:MFS transporter [Bacillus swezeyi]|uniref:MFS transporter n=1 Tax=Bacillus swezeyi TaxID=1925020 RepID=A0A5M8RIQ0_9BACI|nr:MFS transporter [Bacillus swezeyi]KAA6447300.1 MFS transporter [Bacillus swezeyi]KAA6472990.1 MFS transporter [Bacillus swezeyi]TYS32842.1 MFS transporter [Bacillus swezeyi]